MPKRPPRHHPPGYAQEQLARAQQERERERIGSYGAAWRKLRDEYLAAHPQCERAGCLERATDVDHRISRRKGGADVWSNLEALCHSHHSSKTCRDDGGFGNEPA